MKQRIFIFLSLFALVLTACGASDSATPVTVQEATALPAVAPVLPTATPVPSTDAAATDTTSTTLRTDYENAAPVPEQLLAGTFLLDNTDNAITAEQAALLVPLWTSLRDTLQSSTVTQKQIDAITAQIETAMTAEQIAVIANMQLTRESIMTSLQGLGLSVGGARQGNNGTTPQGAGLANGGTPPEGTPPAGGLAGSGTGNGNKPAGSPSQMSTPQVGQGQGQQGMLLPPQLIEALIQYLQGKTVS